MQRRKFLTGATTAGVVAASSAVGVRASVAQDTVRWRMQRYYGTETDHIHAPLADDIRAASGERMELTLFRGAELAPNDQILESLSMGMLEMAQGFGAYWPGRLDLGNIEAGLPMAWSNISEAYHLWYGLGLEDLLREAYAEQGVHYICPMFGGPYDLLTKEPISSLEDLKGMRIRATSTISAVLEQFDIPTVYVPPEELYLGLNTGSLDGVIYGGAHDYKLLKLDEVATHYTELSLLQPGYADGMLVNMRAWESLAPDLQKIVELATKEMAAQQHYWNNTEAQAALQDGGFQVQSLPQDDVMALTEAAQQVWEDEAAKSERNAKAVEMIRTIARGAGRL